MVSGFYLFDDRHNGKVIEEGLRKWSSSAGAWIESIRRGDINREQLLDAPMLELAGEVAGHRMLDVGCGEGRFCRMLGQRGATVVGLEPTAELVSEARRRDPQGGYVRGVGEMLPFQTGRFDGVVSYLTLIDIAGYREAIAEMARVLKPGGNLLVANLQSFATTRDRPWVRDEEGKKLHFAIDDYFGERAMNLAWSGISILNWHRPLEDYMGAFLANGLVLEAFREPRPSAENVREFPSMESEYRVPIFYLMRWRKP